MHRSLRRTALLSGVIGASMLAATSALAHGAPFTIAAGSAPHGTRVAFTATSGTVLLKDTTSGLPTSCASSSMRGSLKTRDSNGAAAFTIDKVNFDGCTLYAGLQLALSGFGAWNLDVTSADDGGATGTLSNVRLHGYYTSGPTCAFDLGASTGSFASSGTATVDPGTAPANYSDGSSALDLPAQSQGALGIWNVNGGDGNRFCVSSSYLKQGDAFSISAVYTITAGNSAYNPITIR